MKRPNKVEVTGEAEPASCGRESKYITKQELAHKCFALSCFSLFVPLEEQH